MLIRLIAIGDKMPSWVNEGFAEYAKRITLFRFQLIEIPLGKHANEKMLAQTKPAHRIIALDEKGEAWSTLQIAKKAEHWQIDNKPTDLLIGGPDGLAADCFKQAELIWSLSPLTLPHPLVRIVVIEQLYRVQSILKGHPYHRA